MKDELLHTPDGVRDIYNGECKKKRHMEQQLHQVLQKYGYQDIQTPTFEFFNIFSREIGTTPSADLYKFFDKKGNTLVLRPDFTPSIARSAVTYYTAEDMPVKLCYLGDAFTNYSDYKGRLKEHTQCGAELIGDSGAAADAEILAMVVDSLETCGLREFQISVGHAQFFQGLLEAAGIEEEAAGELRELISNKNFFGVEEFVETLSLDADLRELFSLLGNFDSTEELSRAKDYAKAYPAIQNALEELEQLREFLKIYGIEKYISIELGIISDYSYYTGIIFSGYTFGIGEPLVKGGRYDKLLSYFGKNAAAIGFAIEVDQLMAALLRQKIDVCLPDNHVLLVFSREQAQAAIEKAMEMRKEGLLVNTLLYDEEKGREYYRIYGAKNHISQIEFLDGN